jgi:hypothetical protein
MVESVESVESVLKDAIFVFQHYNQHLYIALQLNAHCAWLMGPKPNSLNDYLDRLPIGFVQV